MWTVSAIQMHPKGLIVCDEDATLELHVKVYIFMHIFYRIDGNKEI
jgi:glucosamine-6-phosphate deaminase